MKNANSGQDLLRIGVFYDGTYFSHVSNYYLYEHERRARISIGGLHEFIRDEIARQEGVDRRFCQIVDSHYFRGRLSAKLAQAQDSLYRERQFDDVLIREGVTMHFLPVSSDANGEISEKGIDVWFALEAFELAVHKRFDVSVILTGDGDFVPLVRKLNTLGTRVMLLAWDFDFQKDGRTHGTRTSQVLINEVTYPVMMSDEIDSRGRKKDPAIARLFVQRPKEAATIVGIEDPRSAVGGGQMEDSDTRTGVIANLNVDKGYGFVRPDGGGDNMFFHVKSLIDCELAELSPGSAVAFNVIGTDRGPNAVAVRRRSSESVI
jgi:cold shock CspA family protein/uncharacterized LabA/DUF88 family protein